MQLEIKKLNDQIMELGILFNQKEDQIFSHRQNFSPLKNQNTDFKNGEFFENTLNESLYCTQKLSLKNNLETR